MCFLYFFSHRLRIQFNSLQLVSEPRVRFEWELVEEAGKASGIKKFDGIDFAYWRMQIVSLWEEIASASFGDKT